MVPVTQQRQILQRIFEGALSIPADATLAQKTYALALATVSQYQHSQPSGTSLSDTLLSIKTCLANPATGCGSGTANVGSHAMNII